MAIIALWIRSFASETILLESYRGQFLIIGTQAVSKAVHDTRDSMDMASFLDQLHSPPLIKSAGPATGSFGGGTATYGPAPQDSRLFGFSYLRNDEVEVGQIFGPIWIVGIPYWLIAALALAPALPWLRYRRALLRRRRDNLCPACGYDRRAHGSADRCPECGTLPSGDKVGIAHRS